jgi:hypothetical protein
MGRDLLHYKNTFWNHETQFLTHFLVALLSFRTQYHLINGAQRRSFL